MEDPFSTISRPHGREVPHPGAGRIPITVVTGFLGAGKTSLIKSFIETDEGSGTALIVNEFGEIGIDDVLLRESSERTVLLGNSCICCIASTDIQNTLKEMFTERLHGEVPDFKRVIIETSGLADPTPLLQAVASERTLEDIYVLEGMVTIVDCATALSSQRLSTEWEKQVSIADRIILSKTDLVSEDSQREIRASLKGVAPLTPVFDVSECRKNPSLLVTSVASNKPSTELSSASLSTPAAHHHSHAYETFTVTLDEPLSWQAFTHVMEMLTLLRGPDLLRVKGFVNVRDRPGPVVIQFVQHLAHKPEELAAWPDADRRTRLVFITRGIEKQKVATLLDAVAAMEQS